MSERQLIIRLLSLANRSNDMRELIRNVTSLLKNWSQCDAVGIRLKQGEDYPYFVTQGMTDEFVQSENNLCSVSGNGEPVPGDDGLPVLECLCGSVIRGRMPEGSNLLTEFGSFWTNSTSRLLKKPGIAKLLPLTRNRCIAEGYESLALVPLKAEGKTFGLLQLCDTSTDCFADQLIEQCERLAQSIALLISQRQAQASLAVSEERYRQIFNNAALGIGFWSVDGRLLSCNPVGLSWCGLTDIDADGVPASEIVGPEVGKKICQRIARVSETLIPETCEDEVVYPDGESLWFRETYAAVLDDRNKVVGVQVMASEITAEREAHQAMERSERQHRLLVDSAPYPILVVRDGKYLHANQAGATSFGYESPDHLVGMNVFDSIAPEYHETITQRLSRAGKGESNEQIEVRLIRQDGSDVWLSALSVPTTWNGEPAVLVFGFDITERREIQQVISRERERLYSILDAIPVYTYLQTRDYDVKFGNKRFHELFGDPYGRKCYEVFVDQSEPCEPCHTLEAFDSKTPPVREWTDKEGRTFEIHASLIPDTPEGPMVLETGIDITGRKRAEQEVVQEKKRYEALFLSSPVACYAWRKTDEDFVLDSYNERGMKETAGNIARLVGIKLSKLYEKRPDIIADVCNCFETRKTFEREMKYRMQSREDEMDFWVCYAYSPPDTVLIQTVDLTEKHRLEAELQKQEKLESLGVLAGGIAHDFNNILLAILGNVSLAKSLYANESELVELLDEAEKATSRARQLTRQLLTFSEGGTPVKEATRLDDIVTESAEIALRGSDCTCEFSVADSLYTVNIDRFQVSQVIRNLALNAREATPGGGVVDIKIDNYDLESAGKVPLLPGKYVRIRVCDSGVGIPEKNLQRLFDPFFSTKEMGTGLGLAICYSIVRQHGGYISVQSVEGEGSTFTVYLPAFEGPAATTNSANASILTGTGKILIMDDEPSIRMVAQSILGRSGYTVLTAKDGEEAVAAWKAALDEGDGFDLAMLDLTVADGMGGLETLKALKDIDPHARAVVSSGYSTDPVLSDYERHGFCGCITKPYSAAQLTELVNDILAEAGRTT